MGALTKDQEQFVLHSAILAPSADNHHHLRFQLRDDTIRIRHVEQQLPPAGGYKRLLALLSLGALAENLTIAASRFGVATDIVLLPDGERPDLLLDVRVRSDSVEADPLWLTIPLRHTNRQLRFHGPMMSTVQRAELDAAVRAYPTSDLVWLDEAGRRRRALGLMRCAETERFRNPLLHAELFSAIRFDVGWQHSCSEGLPPGSLSVEPPLRPLFAFLRHWRVAKLANVIGTHQMLGFRSCYLPCRLAPHLGLLAVNNSDSQSSFDSGRSFQRLWLLATAHGRVLQPMPASALYACPGALAEGIPEALQQCLAEGWRELIGEATPLMLFRMGSAARSAIISGRRPVADYLELE
jgi:hypothetical protein